MGPRSDTDYRNVGLSDGVLKPLLRNLVLSVAPMEALCLKGGPSISS